MKLLVERDRYRFTGQREKIAGFAVTFGAATCGCVALNLWCREMLPTALRDGQLPWPLCPICLGSGTDPRVPA